MKKVSVIIPVYNVEKYIDKCMESVLNQTYSNLEIILVDDGSPDNSGKMCDEYTVKDNRVKVIHKENGGLSSARNMALDIATGEYVAFIDSDDFVETTMIEKVVSKIEETNADVCMFSYFTYNGETSVAHARPLDKDEYETEEIRDLIIPMFIGQKDAVGHHLLGFVCCQLFRRSSIGEQRFKSEREYYAEDIVFDLEFYIRAKKMCVVNEPLYYYRYVESSLSNRYRKNLFDKFALLLEFKQSFVLDNDIKDCERRILRSAFRSAIGGALNVKKAPELTKKEKKQEIKKIAHHPLVKLSLKTVKPKGIKEIIFAKLLKLKWAGLLLALM